MAIGIHHPRHTYIYIYTHKYWMASYQFVIYFLHIPSCWIDMRWYEERTPTSTSGTIGRAISVRDVFPRFHRFTIMATRPPHVYSIDDVGKLDLLHLGKALYSSSYPIIKSITQTCRFWLILKFQNWFQSISQAPPFARSPETVPSLSFNLIEDVQ